MEISESIFDSISEKNLFRSLQSRWSSSYALYPQLPLAKIIRVSKGEISTREYDDFYLKTNVDYTFCEKGKPILSIEFDGIGGGYSRDGQYVSERATPEDPHRKLKIDAKLRYAKNVGYSLIVVSFEEGNPITISEPLTFLDGILGTIIENREQQKGLAEVETEAVERKLSRKEIEGLACDATTGARMRNLIGKEVDEYWFSCIQQKAFSETTDYLLDPPCENNCFFMPLSSYEHFSVENIKRSIEALKTADRVGCRYTATLENITSYKEVWIRNFIGLGFFPHFIAEDIAKYIVLKNLHPRLPKKGVFAYPPKKTS